MQFNCWCWFISESAVFPRNSEPASVVSVLAVHAVCDAVSVRNVLPLAVGGGGSGYIPRLVQRDGFSAAVWV